MKSPNYKGDKTPTGLLLSLREYMKVILMKSPSYRGERIPIGHLSSSKEAVRAKTNFHPVELLAKRVLYEFPNNPGYCQGNKLLPTK